MKPAVVVIGSFVQDLTWKCHSFPRPGETVIGDFITGPGGKGSNQAVAAARAGAPTLFVGAVGRDLFAEGAAAFYAAEGILARWVVKPGHPTGTAGILVNAAGENEIIVALGASEHLRPADLPAAALRQAQVVICQHEANLPVNAHAFRLARKAGATTVLNPAPMRPDFDPAILRLTDVLIPNESELVALLNQIRPARTRRLSAPDLATFPPRDLHPLCRGLGVPTVIVTLGSRGCLISPAAGQPVVLPAHTGITVADTTGAGDAFVGGFAAGLVKFGGELVRAAEFGNAVAALSVTKFGTAPAMPRAAEIRRFLGAVRRRSR